MNKRIARIEKELRIIDAILENSQRQDDNLVVGYWQEVYIKNCLSDITMAWQKKHKIIFFLPANVVASYAFYHFVMVVESKFDPTTIIITTPIVYILMVALAFFLFFIIVDFFLMRISIKKVHDKKAKLFKIKHKDLIKIKIAKLKELERVKNL